MTFPDVPGEDPAVFQEWVNAINLVRSKGVVVPQAVLVAMGLSATSSASGEMPRNVLTDSPPVTPTSVVSSPAQSQYDYYVPNTEITATARTFELPHYHGMRGQVTAKATPHVQAQAAWLTTKWAKVNSAPSQQDLPTASQPTPAEYMSMHVVGPNPSGTVPGHDQHLHSATKEATGHRDRPAAHVRKQTIGAASVQHEPGQNLFTLWEHGRRGTPAHAKKEVNKMPTRGIPCAEGGRMLTDERSTSEVQGLPKVWCVPRRRGPMAAHRPKKQTTYWRFGASLAWRRWCQFLFEERYGSGGWRWRQ